MSEDLADKTMLDRACEWLSIYYPNIDRVGIMITIFILIYLASVATFLIICYRENKNTIFTVGDLIDKTEFFMWFPLINTGTLIIFGILMMITKITNLLKLSVLWEKFRNIKLK